MMTSYLEFARVLPRPDPRQIESFLEHVSEADNWLKLLPLEGGPELCVLLDPNAGARVNRFAESGQYVVETLTPASELLHGSELPTDEYRSRFGFLGYHVQTGGGTLALEGGVFIRALMPQPGIIHAGALLPIPQALRQTAARPGAFLHGTLRGASDAGGARRFRYAVERLAKLESVPDADPLIERIRSWIERSKREDESGFRDWLRSRHDQSPEELDEPGRWRHYVEWRDDDACMRLHAEQDRSFQTTGIPEEVTARHGRAVEAVRRSIHAMLATLDTL
ncbi:MAG: hypothetical protein JSW67_07515 [Candidatus Latescibacterota bacterium]|nr:MAG: hypothetical protein JSW67_07515 [Candidatus Latescibacterota bacterium]